MIRHIILWKLKEAYNDGEKERIKQGIKEGLEGLAGEIPGLEEITVWIDGLETSNADAMLDTLFTDMESYVGYKSHPAHVEVANSKVRPFYDTRLCLDFEQDDYMLSRIGPLSESKSSVAYAEGMAAGKNAALKDLIKRKMISGQTSTQIAEDLQMDIMDIEMLIVQVLERC